MTENKSFYHLIRIMTFVLVAPAIVVPVKAVAVRGPTVEEQLQGHGFKTKSDEDLQVILNDKVYRLVGLRLLVERKGQDAIPILKNFLDDESFRIRIVAARLLGQIGDTSGLPVMQKDYESYVIMGLEQNHHDLKRLKISSIYVGLEIAQVLAELGDYRGYDLADSVLDGGRHFADLRDNAAEVIGVLARADPALLSAKGINLFKAYDKAIATIRDPYLIKDVLALQRKIGSRNLPVMLDNS